MFLSKKQGKIAGILIVWSNFGLLSRATATPVHFLVYPTPQVRLCTVFRAAAFSVSDFKDQI